MTKVKKLDLRYLFLELCIKIKIMKPYKIFLSIFILSVFLSSGSGCGQQENQCLIPNSFTSYEQAEDLLFEREDLIISEFKSTPNSSFVRDISFFSCDALQGALLIGLNDELYFYSSVPTQVWHDFKNASSKGSFYNKNIKGVYPSVKAGS